MFLIDEYYKILKEYKDSPVLTDRDGKRTLSYQEFNQMSDKIAGQLIKKGVRQGDSVIILLPRCSEYIAAEVAMLKLGVVIVPLIPDYPKERIDFIKKDCGAVLVVDEIFLAKQSGDTTEFDYVNKEDTISGKARAMILYTSGSTGNPKGVVYTRDNVDAHMKRRIDCVKDIHPLVFAASSTLSFCVSVTEYHRTMILGGHIHIISEEVRADAEKLADYYAEHKITSGFISPRILKDFKSKSDCLYRVFVGSERVVNTYSDQFQIRNVYGQSETVAFITEFIIDKFYDNTPLGKPLKGIEIVIVDGEHNPVADGEEGEICIIGDLPHEYNNLPEQTAKTFKRLSDGRTAVYTGDIGKILPDGNLLYLNRNDWMLKIHGQRVEPGEIESVMNKVEGITGSIVKAFDNEDGTMLLCGFYTESKPVNKSLIYETLKKHLPHYMIPGTFIKMDAFPVNANGKIDRKSIQKPDLKELRVTYEKPENETEELLCQAMEKVLHIVRIGRNDNFMELGGNSLNAVRLCAECSIKGLAPQLVIIGQTPAGISKLLEEKSFCEKPEMKISGNIKSSYPLSFSQRYEYDACHSHNVPIDVNDIQFFFELEESIDFERLKAAVEAVVKEHPIYLSHIDIENKLLLTCQDEFQVKEVLVPAEEFRAYRDKRYRRVRDLNKDPLFEAEIIRTSENKVYLFICMCHLIYDGKSLKNFISGVEAKYNGTDEALEKATIFDQIDYEVELTKDNELLKNAIEVFDENYKDLKPVDLFEGDMKYETGFSRRILEGISQEDIDACLKKYSISILTLFEGAMEMTVEKMFGIKDFCYSNVYDGRTNHLLSESHGVFAKAVFLRSSRKSGSLQEFFKSIEKQYQKLVYFDVVDNLDIIERYPLVKSGISFNYRDLIPISIGLGDKRYRAEFMNEFYEVNKPFADFDFIINKLPLGYGYNVTISSAKISNEFAEEFAARFDKIVKSICKEEI